MILAPLVMGGTMAVFFNPRFALFCLLSPVLMLFNLIDNRFSRRRGLRAREEKFAADLVQFDKRAAPVEGGVATPAPAAPSIASRCRHCGHRG